MAEFKIDGRMTVRQLKENFKNEFEGTLRVYNGREKADDSATLASIRVNDDAKGGELVCRASRTVGKFEQEMLDVFGIKVQVASPDDWFLALDGITLANLKNIKKNATKADMEELVAYKRKEKEVSEDCETNNDICEEETSTPDLLSVTPQDGYMFLSFDWDDDDIPTMDMPEYEDDEESFAEDIYDYFMNLMVAVCDYNNNEPFRNTLSYDLLQGDGAYIEVKQRVSSCGETGDLYWTDKSKVYIVKDGKIIYSGVPSEYLYDGDFETEEGVD